MWCGEPELEGSSAEASERRAGNSVGETSRAGILGGGIELSSEVSVLSSSLLLFEHRKVTQEEHLHSLG